jgi:clan AA aspartic protease
LSGFAGLVPAVRIRLRNLPLKMDYPSDGSIEAIVDTGYEGFLAVPTSIFRALHLDEMVTRRAMVEVADGRKLRSNVAYGTVELDGVKGEIDGPVETVEGLREVLVGVRLLSEFRVTLDYCLRVVSIHPCE